MTRTEFATQAEALEFAATLKWWVIEFRAGRWVVEEMDGYR